MSRTPLLELLEAVGAILVVAGLALCSVPAALVVAGCFILLVANTPGPAPPASPPTRGRHRAETRQ